MHDWYKNYMSIAALNEDITNLNAKKCGWYIKENEFSLVTRIDAGGKEYFTGKPCDGDTIRFYAFSGRMSDSVFGQHIPVQIDERP